jgi:hypothetical protein
MKSSRFPRRKIGRLPHITAKEFVKKQDMPITKIPQPKRPFNVLYDTLNCSDINAKPGAIIGPCQVD